MELEEDTLVTQAREEQQAPSLADSPRFASWWGSGAGIVVVSGGSTARCLAQPAIHSRQGTGIT